MMFNHNIVVIAVFYLSDNHLILLLSILAANYHVYSSPFIITVLFIILLAAAKFHLSSSPLSNSSDSATVTTQFGLLNVVPLSFFITSFKSSIRHIQSSSFVILLGLLLSGDNQLNPGPTSSTFNICTLNIRSPLNPLKYTAISDLATSMSLL